MAPEQLDPTKATTRSALVDSFGIGMTIYFMVSSRHPGAGDSKSITWAQTVRDACSRLACAKWASLPNRLARLIVAATQDDQVQRPTVAEIQLELSRLTETLKSSSRIPTDLVVEEIACRAFGDKEYEWLEGLGRARRMLAKGIAIELGLEDEWMTLSVAWLASGMEDRKKLVKYLPDATQRAVSVLRSGGWVDVQHNVGPGQFRIDASADGQTLLERMDALANALGRVEREFSFS